jgi:FAD/FMN-containing dehydrogenase
VIAGTWHDPADSEKNTRWVRDYYEALIPYSEEGGYINFMAGDDEGLTEGSYGAKFSRLQEIKARYDPDNLFRVNQNILPAS